MKKLFFLLLFCITAFFSIGQPFMGAGDIYFNDSLVMQAYVPSNTGSKEAILRRSPTENRIFQYKGTSLKWVELLGTTGAGGGTVFRTNSVTPTTANVFELGVPWMANDRLDYLRNGSFGFYSGSAWIKTSIDNGFNVPNSLRVTATQDTTSYTPNLNKGNRHYFAIDPGIANIQTPDSLNYQGDGEIFVYQLQNVGGDTCIVVFENTTYREIPPGTSAAAALDTFILASGEQMYLNFQVTTLGEILVLQVMSSPNRKWVSQEIAAGVAIPLNEIAYGTGASISSSDVLAYNPADSSLNVNNIKVWKGRYGLSENTAVGKDAMSLNTTGNLNTAIGFESMKINTTGGSNTAVGRLSLSENTTGSNNTAIGISAMRVSTTGGSNTAVGVAALRTNSTGHSNVAIGYNSLFQNTTGIGNIAIGRSAGHVGASKKNTISIMYDSLGLHPALDDSTAQIGRAMNHVKLGDTYNFRTSQVLSITQDEFVATYDDATGDISFKASSGGGVTAVTATAPLSSSGGATPDISLTGIVPIANGGTGSSSQTAWLLADSGQTPTGNKRTTGTFHQGSGSPISGSSFGSTDGTYNTFFSGIAAFDETNFVNSEAFALYSQQTTSTDKVKSYLVGFGNDTGNIGSTLNFGTRVHGSAGNVTFPIVVDGLQNLLNGATGAGGQQTCILGELGIEDGGGGSWDFDATVSGGGTLDLAFGGTVQAFMVQGGGGIWTPSDKRLKTEVRELSVLESIEGMRGVRYTFKKSGKKSIGVIAQEIQKFFPEAVTESSNGFLAVDYQAIAAIALQGAKENKEKIDLLEAQLFELHKRLENLETQAGIIPRKNMGFFKRVFGKY